MTKEDMKNRISLALKDPILQQGFEIICKKNEELKKSCDETQELLDKQIEATFKLDKENAELKAKNKWYSEQVCNKECAEVWGELDKAKELLNEFMRISKASDEDFEHDYSELIGETEQFLNSEVEK